MTGALLLAPHLTLDNVAGLLDTATHKTKEEIELLLAHRFPRHDVPERVQPINPSPQPLPQPESPSAPLLLAPKHVPSDIPHAQAVSASLPAPERVPSLPLQPPSPSARITPLAPERFAVQFTMSQAGRDDLREIQALLAHQQPSRNVAEVIEAALKLYRAHLGKRKFAATDRPRHVRKPARAGSRYVPAHVRKAVWQRDGGRCTFVTKTASAATSAAGSNSIM